MGEVGPNGPVPFKSPLIYDPYVNYLLTILTCLRHIFIISCLLFCRFRRYEAWRFFSYMLIHSGWALVSINGQTRVSTFFLNIFQNRPPNRFIHIGTNILVQVVLGIPLEMVHSWWRVLIIYMAGVTAGSLGTTLMTHFFFYRNLMQS